MTPRFPRTLISLALLAFAEPTPSAQNTSIEHFAVSVSVPASCRVTRQAEDASATSNPADPVTLQCVNSATGADPRVSVSEPVAGTAALGEGTHRVVTIDF